MPGAGDGSHRESKRPALGRGLIVLGAAISIVSIAADALGIGGRPDIGPRQALAAIVGVVILLAGGALASTERTTRFRLGYAVFVIAFSLLLFAGAELLLRVEVDAWPFELPRLPMPYLTAKDANLRWRMPPGGKNNSLGFKNREIGAKPPGTCRVLFLGDSLLYLGDLSEGGTYLEALEDRMRAALGDHYEVINAGVPGYTTYQEVELLHEYGYDFDPDVVFLGFVLNDLYQPYLHRPSTEGTLAVDPNARLTRFDTHGLLGDVFGWSYAAHELVLGFEVLTARMSDHPRFNFDYREDLFLAWKDYGWRDTEPLLAGLANELDARHLPFYVMLFPVREQVRPSALELDRERVLLPQRRLRQFLARRGLPMLDAQPALLEHGGDALFVDHLHLKPEGNAVIADFLSGFVLEEAKRWPAPCSAF